jgi:hypothetical protein
MIDALDGTRRTMVAGDKAYDTQDAVAEMRRLGVIPTAVMVDPSKKGKGLRLCGPSRTKHAFA